MALILVDTSELGSPLGLKKLGSSGRSFGSGTNSSQKRFLGSTTDSGGIQQAAQDSKILSNNGVPDLAPKKFRDVMIAQPVFNPLFERLSLAP